MKQKVSDYISQFLVQNGITDMFCVVGGGAMHLNDSFGHQPGLTVTYNHHEQASAIAAEAYARVNNRIAAVCVTSGPGATNAITGALCGWMDSIPMLIFSGQARYDTTVYASGLKLRTRGVQEFDIIGSVRNMTKYCELVRDADQIRYCLEKALHLAKSGRPGPCWLDIPLDIQGAYVETDELLGYAPEESGGELSPETVDAILERLRRAQRPLVFIGNGVRLAGAHEAMMALVERIKAPVITGMSSVDAIWTDHPLYVGRSATTGDRAGNFAVQSADLLLSFGSRLSYFQTGFNDRQWATHAYKIVNDIDPQELEKDSIRADMKVCCDVGVLIDALLKRIEKPLPARAEWQRRCAAWKERYPVVLPKHYADSRPNIYAFYKEMTRRLPEDAMLVASAGTSRVAGSQASVIHRRMRFITNPSTAAMGYCLPAAIGVCIANRRKRTVVVTGEGSLQMNLQELQTIVQNRLPICVFVMNNQGYHSIRMTQHAFFGEPLVGVGEESGDLSFPDLAKLAPAYGVAFRRCERMEDMTKAIEWALAQNACCLCEMMLSKEQITEPKVASRRLPDGRMLSGTFENMAPFLSPEEVRENTLPDGESGI